MDTKKIKDLMTPLEGYAVVTENATLIDAVNALEEAQKKLAPGRQKHRAVLVVDKKRKIIGKIGHLAFLKALEPKYNVLGDIENLTRTGVSAEFVESMMANYRFFQDNLTDLCRRAGKLLAKDVMHSVSESIDENASLAEGIHTIVMHQSLSILVTRKGEVIGLLRLSDLFEELTKEMKRLAS